MAELDVDPQQRIQELEAALNEAKQQIDEKDREIAELKEQLHTQSSIPKLDVSKVEEMQRLQDKLAALKREQAEADAAKEASWRQLKSAVLDVVQLANPEHIASLAASTVGPLGRG